MRHWLEMNARLRRKTGFRVRVDRRALSAGIETLDDTRLGASPQTPAILILQRNKGAVRGIIVFKNERRPVFGTPLRKVDEATGLVHAAHRGGDIGHA